MLRAVFVLTAALGCFSLVVLAQPAAQPDKKTDSAKAKDDGKSKSKTPEKTGETGKDPPKAKDKMKLPKDAVVIVADDILDALGFSSKMVLITPERYQELLDQIDALKRQAKPERKVPTYCKLHGKLDGDFLVFRADFDFATESPKTTVVLGLQGGFLIDEGDLDRQTPTLLYDKDDGYLVVVEKDAEHHKLTLNFRVPVKRAAAGATDREIKLGLPGATSTFLNLELPGGVKEVRWNGVLEKAKQPGRWPQIGLGEKRKELNLAWKEPVVQAGNNPLVTADGQINVMVDEKDVHITADLTVSDSQAQTKEWRLLLPPGAEAEIKKAPGGLTGTVVKDEKKGYHLLKVSDYTAEAWKVQVTLNVPRLNPGAGRVAVGPFHVLDAIMHQGTITVQMPSKSSLGQRLTYVRAAGTYQKGTDVESAFRYVAPPVTEKTAKAPAALKAPVELEWRTEKNQVETQVTHDLNLRTANPGWQMEGTTRIQVKALAATLNTIDLRLPQPRPRGVGMLGTASPGLAFPGTLPWAGIWKAHGVPWTHADPDDFSVTDESGTPLTVVPQDGLAQAGRMHVLLERTPAPKQVTLVLKTKIRIPPQNQRIRVELPTPVGTFDRGAKLTIQTDKQTELLHGPAGAEVPVPDRDRFDLSWDQAPTFVDIAWRPFQREIVAQSTIDVTLYERTAQVTQALRIPHDDATAAPDAKNGQIALKVPPGIDEITLVSPGAFLQHDPARPKRWLRPGADADQAQFATVSIRPKSDAADIVLQYDLVLTDRLEVLSIWPADHSRKDAKVRVWSAPAVKVRLSEDAVKRGGWKERSIEVVPGVEQFPSLVAHGAGADLPLSLQIEKSAAPTPAAFVADRALIQVTMLEDGSQQCRARYLIRRMHGPHVDIRLPTALAQFREAPSVFIGKKPAHAEPTNEPDTLRVKLHPELAALPTVLEIAYTIPGDPSNTFWRTTLHAPKFRSEVLIRQMRWQLTTPTPMIAGSLGRNVRADVQWGWNGWLLTPESASNGLDSWAMTGEPEAGSLTYSFTHVTLEPEAVVHLPRHWWLLGCSGLFLIVTLGGYYLPLSRVAYGLLLASLALAILILAVLFPAAAPPVLFGLQPGVVLFLGFVGILWVAQERQRRQLIFMPGFTRKKSGSTLIRTDAAQRPREASTVDAPGGTAPDEGTAPKTASSSS